MAKTKLQNYTVQEKLNKMDVDLIDVTVTPDNANGGGMDVGDFMFPMVEIPNAVAVKGGTAILQSCCAIVFPMIAGAFDIVITSHDSTSTKLQHGGGDILDDDLVSGITDGIAIMDGTCGFFSLTNGFDAGVVALADKKNIGLVCKAAAGSTSLYVWGIVQNTGDYTGDVGSTVLRLGFVKD